MRTFLLRRLPWLAALLAACGDDTQQLPEEGSSSSGTHTSSDSTSWYSDTGIDDSGSGSSSGESSGSSSEGSSGDVVDSSEGGSSSGAPNLGPTAMDDEYFTRQGEVLDVTGSSVLDNDVDPESDLLVVTAFDAVSAGGGTVDVDTGGAFVYTPAAGFFGVDTFGYTASDETTPATGQVTVHVAPVRPQLADVAAGIGGFVVDSEQTGAGLGYALASMGDLDGDGLDDLLVSAPYGGDYVSSGRSYVVFGKPDHDPVTLGELESGSGGGFAILEGDASEGCGRAVANAGDVNGDGIADILLGEPFADAGGLVHLVFGKTDTTPVDLADVDDGTGGLSISSTSIGSGYSLAGIGDLDADGYGDFFVGSPFVDDLTGGGHVVFGAADLGAFDLGDVGAGVRGFVVEGELPSTYAGTAAAGLGDINGDGIGDLGIGAPGDPYFSEPGTRHSFVVFGKVDEAPLSLASLEADEGGFVLVGDSNGAAGHSIHGIGDIDGDGLGDLVIGDPAVGNTDGRAYVVFGKTDSAPIVLTQLGDAGFTIEGEDSWDLVGYSVDGAGDVNGDGIVDVIVGARGAGPNGDGSGAAYVVYGDPELAAIDLGEVAMGIGGFAMDGVMEGDLVGSAVAGAGDINGDGLADVVVGAYAANGSMFGFGHDGFAYVVFGVRTAPP